MNVFNENVGDGDRVVRVLIGSLLIGFVMGLNIKTLGWYSVMALVAIPVIMTAILRWDPLYGLFNHSTAKTIPMMTLGFMATNIGKTDVIVRYAIGISMLIAFMTLAPTPVGWAVAVPLIAAVAILTGVIGWDPLYATFKLNTLEQQENLPSAVIIEADFRATNTDEKSVAGEGIDHSQDDHPKVA